MAGIADLLADPRHPDWGEPLPDWVTAFRPHQRAAIESVVAALGPDGDASTVVLSAPTGSGKTLVSEAVRRLLRQPATYVCVDRGLQDQVLRDFPYAAVVKGRSNYPTLDAPDRFGSRADSVSCDDCTGVPDCKWCTPNWECPYLRAKRAAGGADLAVLNTAYFLAEANSGPKATFTGRDLVVADEADRLESALMSHVGVQVGRKRMEEWGVDPLANAAPADAAAEWVEHRVLPALDESVKRRLASRAVDSVRVQRELRGLRKLRSDLVRVLAALPGGGWVACEDRGVVEFKPVRVAEEARGFVWRHASQWLLMSATVLGPEKMFADLGVADPWSWAEVDMPSTFPVENRPVYLCGVAHVTHSNPSAARQLAPAIEGMLGRRHAGDRVLVHTVSFKLQNQLREFMPDDDRHVWYESGQREECLRRYIAQPGSVLFAPSMERGVDLPDDACRAVIVCKTPFPNLGDAQVSARLAGGDRAWYMLQALRSLVQMSGRGVRHERDSCPTYVLDAQADRLLAQCRKYVPRWWSDAVVRGGPE